MIRQSFALGTLLTLATSHALAGTTWLVSNNPAENPDFPGLYEALESPLVVSGDTIEVSQGLGVYMPPIDQVYRFHGKAITVIAQPNEQPILDVRSSEGLCCAFATIQFEAEGRATIIDGFRIRSGIQYAIHTAGASPTIRNCVISESSRQSPVITGSGHPLFQNCEFTGLLGVFGPNIEAYGDVRFEDCLFTANPSSNGGVRIRSNATFVRCDFIGNDPTYADVEGEDSATLVIDACRFLNTSVGAGSNARPVISAGGLTTISNSVFSASSGPNSPLIVLHSATPVFSQIINCTFSGNTVPDLVETRTLAAAAIRNCIAWNNTLTGGPFTGAVAVTYSNIQGGYAGTGNINANPAFKAAGQGDFRLNTGSPCIDRADASAIPPGVTLDAAGKPRFFDDPATSNNNAAGTPPYLDMGAYEYQGPFICIPDLTTTANPFAPGFGTPNGVLNNDDFFYYLLLFENANPQADMTATAIPGTPGYGVPNGVINNDDFFYYLSLFAAGCNP